MKSTINQLKNELVVLKAMVDNMEKHIAELEAQLNPVEEIPQVVVEEELPILPEEIIIPEETMVIIYSNTPSREEEVMLGCQILNEFNVNYIGCADYIELHLTQKDYGKENLFLDKKTITCDVYDENGKLLGSKSTAADNVYSKHPELKNKIHKWAKDTFIPKKVTLAVK